MIIQSDIVVAVRVTSVVQPNETLDDVYTRLQNGAMRLHEDLMGRVQTGNRDDVVDQNEGGFSVTQRELT